MNYIITKNKQYFENIGNYNFCELKDMILPTKIAIDTETTGLDFLVDDIFCIQIGTGENNYLIDLQDVSTPLFNKDSFSFKDVVPYLDNKVLVGHNIGFDLSFFYKNGFYPEKIIDTMVGSMILHNGDVSIRSHSFGNVMERELNVVYDKSEQKNINKIRLSTQKSIQYCFNDVDKLLDLANDLIQKLIRYKALDTFILNSSFIKALTYIETCGLPIDTSYWKRKIQNDEKKKKELEKEISEYIYDNIAKFRDNQLNLFSTEKKIKIKLSSPKQMIDVFSSLGINTIDDEGKQSIEESVINKTKHPFVDLWLDYQFVSHRITTFGENILEKEKNGRLYTRFKPILDTCRIASRKGEINFLNFPSDKETRECFRAKEGYKFIVCDFDNQEATILADKSRNPNTLKVINEGADSHSILAREIYPEIRELSDNEIKKLHNDKRQIGKIANFTFAFGGNGYTAAKNLNITEEEGNRIYEAYKSINAPIFDWGEKVFYSASYNGYIEYSDGFKLKLPYFEDFKEKEEIIKKITKEQWKLYKEGKESYKKSKEDRNVDIKTKEVKLYLKLQPIVSSFFKTKSKYMRLCLNAPIQGTAAHQTKRASLTLFNIIKQNGHLNRVKIVNQVHDEINLEVEESFAEMYREILQKTMRDAANYYLTSGLVKMGATANIGKSWYEAK